MASITVTALRQFTFGGRTVERDQAVDMEPRDAAIHARKQNVSLTRTQTRDVTADDAEPAPRKRRNYRRRDMVPEP